MSRTKEVEVEEKVEKNASHDTAESLVWVTPPEVEAVIEPVVPTNSSVPVGTVERTSVEALVEPVAILPNLVYEQTAPVVDGTMDAPNVLTTKGANAKRVEVICDQYLGTKALKKGDITDDDEYVALLQTERGRGLVREVK